MRVHKVHKHVDSETSGFNDNLRQVSQRLAQASPVAKVTLHFGIAKHQSRRVSAKETSSMAPSVSCSSGGSSSRSGSSISNSTSSQQP